MNKRKLVKLLPSLGKERCWNCRVPLWAANPHPLEVELGVMRVELNWVCEYCWSTNNRRDLIPVYYRAYHQPREGTGLATTQTWHLIMDSLLQDWED